MTILICSISWILAYGLAIRRGFKDETCGFPIPAVIINVAWEFVYTFIFPDRSPVAFVSGIWFALDLILLYQIVRFHKRSLSPFNRLPALSAAVLAGLAVAGIVIVFSEINHYWLITSAFGQNFVMSVLFATMLFTRDDTGGQSLYIGMLKMIGTGSAILSTLLASNGLSIDKTFLFTGIILFDGVYIIGLYTKLRNSKTPPLYRI